MRMFKFLTVVKRKASQVRGLLDSPLPTGKPAFEEWTKSIIDTYDLPTHDDVSIRWALAAMCINLGPTVDKKPKYYFVKALRAAATKQVAQSVFTEIKTAQQAAQKAAEEASKAPTEKLTLV